MVRIGVVLLILAAGCFRSSPPPASPASTASPATEPARLAYHEPQATYAHARFRSTGQPPGERGVIAEAIDRLGEFADDMCACSDRTCADRVSQDMTRWSMELSKTHEDLKPTEDEMEEASQVTERLSKCMMTAMGYGNPPPPPSSTP